MGRVGGAYAYWLLTVGIVSLLGISQVTIFRSGCEPNKFFNLTCSLRFEINFQTIERVRFAYIFKFFNIKVFASLGNKFLNYRTCIVPVATAERRYKKERWSDNYMHMAAFSTYKDMFTLPSLLLHPSPPLTPPSNAITRAAGLRALSAPHPPPPPEDYGQILATSPKVEVGLLF